MTEAKNENRSALRKTEAWKHRTPEYYKDLSEAGKRRERKKRPKGGYNAETLHASVEGKRNKNITTEASLTPLPSREQTTSSSSNDEPRQQHNEQDRTRKPQRSPTRVAHSVQPSTRLRGSSRQALNRHPDTSHQHHDLASKTPVTICPPPPHYTILSGPGKRRDRRFRQKQAANLNIRQEDASDVEEPPISTIDAKIQCHTSLDIFNCGHFEHDMCYACSAGKRPIYQEPCDLYFMRRADIWMPDVFIRFIDESCTRCPPSTRRFINIDSAHNQRCALLAIKAYIRSWFGHSDRNSGRLTVERLLFHEEYYLQMKQRSGTWQGFFQETRSGRSI
jgi:hypothetical protein